MNVIIDADIAHVILGFHTGNNELVNSGNNALRKGSDRTFSKAVEVAFRRIMGIVFIHCMIGVNFGKLKQPGDNVSKSTDSGIGLNVHDIGLKGANHLHRFGIINP